MNETAWDPIRISNLRAGLEAVDAKPNRRWGQNFLIDANVLEKIMRVAAVEKTDTVLEVGVGAGALTRRLAAAARRVIGLEIDERLKPLIERSLQGYDNVQVVFTDALAIDWQQFRPERDQWRFVANVPYYITGPLLTKALQVQPNFQRITMMVQLEVAQRLVAGPGSKSYGALSVLTAYYGTAQMAFTVSPGSFWPQPRVWSAVVVIDPRPLDPDGPKPEHFYAVVRAAFGLRRKMLRNALADDPHLKLSRGQVTELLATAGIEEARRAETLSLEEFARLAQALGEMRRDRLASREP